jgi:DNA-directed RNA polymerase sigma subunit (sigma70/sigma32)
MGVTRSVKQRITSSLLTLPPEEKAIIDASYGITSGAQMGDDEIAQQLLIKEQDVKETRDAALRSLLGYGCGANGKCSKSDKEQIN